jgi:hypothetical protein
MLRLIHEQTVIGALLIDDIDDGLPNKQVKRLGSTANPDAYARDGYASAPKQPCYIPRTNPDDATLPGYIDLEETQRVTHSAFNGKIKGMQTAGLLRVVSLTAADLAAPVVTAAQIAVPAAGDVTITGTGFLSVEPAVTRVEFWGAGVGGTSSAPAVVLTTAQIIAVPPGAVGATSIVVDTTINGALAAGDFVRVVADGIASNVFTITV